MLPPRAVPLGWQVQAYCRTILEGSGVRPQRT